MLFLDGVYEVLSDGSRLRFQWVREPTSAHLTQLAHTIARRVGRMLEREGLLERDTEHLSFDSELFEDDPMPDLVGHSITYRIAVGPHRGRKVFTLQTLPICNEEDWATGGPGNVAGFSLHAGVAVKASQRDKLTAVPIHLPSSSAGNAGFAVSSLLEEAKPECRKARFRKAPVPDRTR